VPVDAAFSPDGRLLLTTGAAGVARLWRTASGQQAAVLDAPGQRVLDAAFDPRGRFVLTTSDDSTARLWQTSTGSEVARLRARGPLLAATFGPRGPIVLTGAAHRPPALRDVRTPGRIVALAGQTEPPANAVFSPDGRLLLTFGGSRAAHVFDTRSGRTLATLPTKPSEASFSRDGRFIVTVGERVRVWRTAGGKPVAALDQAVHAVLSSDGRRVLTVYGDGSAIVWQRAGPKRLERVSVLPGFSSPPSGHVGLRFPPTGTLSTDGRLAATTDLDAVRVWDTANGKMLASIAAGYASLVGFSPDGRLLASATGDGTVVLSQAVPSTTIETGHGPPNNNLCCGGFEPVLSPKGNLVVAATRNDAAVWRTDGKELGRLPQPFDTVVSSASFSADGSLVATNNLLNVAIQPLPVLVTTVWRTRGLERVAVVPGQAETVALSPDGRFVVTDDYETGRTVWRVSSLAGIPPPAPARLKGERVVQPADPWRRARLRARVPALRGTVAFDVDSRRAVVAGGPGGVRVVRVPHGELISTLEGRMRSLDEAAFSPDGTRLVGGVDGGLLRLWDPASGRLVSVLGRSNEWAARFSADGKLVLMSASDRLSVRRASDGKLVRTLSTPGLAVFSPDGAFAAIPEAGGRLAIVDLAAEVTTELQTGTAAALTSAAFVPRSRLLVAWDANGNVQVVACEICATESALSALARDRLARITHFRVPSPVVPLGGVG
jgi:WD40 repeat protein